MTYLLRRSERSTPTRDVAGDDLAPRVQDAWQAFLADKSFLPEGGLLGYPCCHLYHQDSRFQSKPWLLNRQSSTMLKGRDHLVAATAIEAGLKVRFTPYMFENCADETWQLDRFPTPEEKSKLGRQMESSDLEENLPIRASSEKEGDFGVTWLEPPPSSDKTTWQSRTARSGTAGGGVLHSCDYCPWGYFGNESSEVDLYTYAALHIEIPEFGQGLRAASKSATRTKMKRARSIRKGNAKQE